jgi:anti-sigma factor RsiW
MSEYSEFDCVLSRYLDGTLGTEELAELEAKLVGDEAFAEHVSRWCLAHRQITELLTETKLHDLMDQFVQGNPTLPRGAFRQATTASASSRRIDAVMLDRNGAMNRGDRLASSRVAPWKLRSRLILGAVTATFLGMIALFATKYPARKTADDLPKANQMAASSAPKQSAQPTESPSSPDAAFIATLTQLVDGVWVPGAPVFHHGQQLAKGSRVALASGMAKVTYDCGAEVVLQGPCEFMLQDSMLGYLTSGRLTAHVPRRAFSFAILSPQVDFVDLGTSFGVDVGDSGRTQLHVFEGEVLCSQPKKLLAGRGDAIHVVANKAMEFTTSTEPPSDIAVNEEQFSRLIALRRAADFTAGHLVEDKLALWLAADIAVTTDLQRRVISWQDIIYGDNQSAEDAIQINEDARPRLVADAVNGRPAIRFDGESDFLLTTPLETTDDQTVLMVMQYSPSAYHKDRRWGGQILNYDGPDRESEDINSDQDLAERTRYLSNTLVPGVLQIGEPLLEEEFKPTLLTGQVFAGFIGSAVVESGRVDTVQIGPDTPVVLAFVYDYETEQGKSFLAINGRSYGEKRAFAPQAVTSRKIIGRHAWKQLFFHGDLAELLIFNKALSAEELAETTAYLADKYRIAFDREAMKSAAVDN